MDLILHCGDSKTGSSSIQASLQENTNHLLKNGIVYYTTGKSGHWNLSYLVGVKHRVGSDHTERKYMDAVSTISRIHEIAAGHNVQYVLLSSEYFFSFSKAQIDQLLSHFRIRFDRLYCVVYIRCPLGHFLSMVQQKVKASHTIPDPRTYSRRLDHALTNWCAYVGKSNFFLTLFDKDHLVSQCVVTDFEDKLARITGRPFLMRSKERLNETLSAEQMILLQRFRREFLSNRDDMYHPVSTRIVRFFEGLNKSKALPATKPRLSDWAALALQKNARSVCKLVDEAFPGIAFEETCLSSLLPAGDADPSKFTFCNRMEEILRAYDPHLIALLEDCLPYYNPSLVHSLQGRFLQSQATRDSSGFFEQLGAYLSGEGLDRAALQAFDKALKLDRASAEVCYLLSQHHKRRDRFEEALACALKAVELEERNPQFQHHLGNLFLRKGYLEHAEVAQRRAAELAPGLPLPRFQLSVIHTRRRRFDAALEEVRAAIELKGDDPRFYRHLAELERMRGRPSPATEALRKAEVLESEDSVG